MANTFKNGRAAATASLATVYTVPASTTSIVLLAQATNVGSGAQAVTFCWYDASGSVKTELVKLLSVPEKAAVGLIAGKLVLETGDYLQVQSTASSLIELSISVLEIT
jgi:hypothetical protein|tara:strand:+ start:224 stop:547 length:324 start_codon:yes stop_codon:yes gene_type:complete